MKAAANAVQVAIYAVLAADATLMALIEAVYDAGGVPEGAELPYVTIGSVSSLPFVTFGRSGEWLTAGLMVWTRASGFKEDNTILSRLNELLGDTHLTVTGYDLARSTFDRYNNLQDPSLDVEQIAVFYRILLQEAD